jgi:flagellar motor switch protein FliM
MADILSQSQIDALLNNLISGETKLEPVEKEEGDGKVKIYDFSSPKKVTRENLKMLSGIYEGYARIISSYLTAVLRLVCEVELDQIDESIFYEYNNALTDSVLMCVVDFLMPDTKLSFGQILVNIPKPLAFLIIDKLMGGDGDDYKYDRDFTDIELSILDNTLRYVMNQMKDAWANSMPIGVEYNKIETNARFIQNIGYNDTVLLIMLETVIKNISDKITICIPTMVIDEIFKKSENVFRTRRGGSELDIEKDKESIMNYLKASYLNVTGILGGTELSLHDVLNIQIGDVIVLDDKADEDIIMKVENKTWFKGKWGAKRKRNAIKINEVLY